MKTSGRRDIQVRNFLQQSLDFIAEHDLLPEGQHLLLSVSGGPDSMALLPLAFELKKKRPGLDIKVLYIHHNTRAEQRKEQRFVAHWAAMYGFSFASEVVGAWQGGTRNFEARARAQRKDFVARHAEGRVVFTGHHLDDSYEWFLMQSSRSTNVFPRGIPLVNGRYRRPWLCAQKKQILRFLHAIGQPYMCDPSNREVCVHERNRLRHEVMAPLKRLYPQLIKNYVHRQNVLALQEATHRLKGSPGQVRSWERGVSLFAPNWEARHDPLRVEQLKHLIHQQGPSTRAELCGELYKLLKALRSGAKGPHKLARSVHLYLWGNEVFILPQEDLAYYRRCDEDLTRHLAEGAQISAGVPIIILPSQKGSLKAAHPLFPNLCHALKQRGQGWQTPGRCKVCEHY